MENGAENGDKTNTTSHAADTLATMECLVAWHDEGHPHRLCLFVLIDAISRRREKISHL